MSNEAGSHLFLPSANDIPFGKTLSSRSMRSIQEEEPVLDPIGRSPSTTVPTPDAEYFGSPNDDRGFGPSFSYVAEQGRMAKGSDTEEEEEEELAWAKHTSIVTDYGEDVWVKPSPRLGVQLTAPEAMRGSRRNSKLARGTSDEVDDELEDPMTFTKFNSLLTDGGEDVRWGAFLTDDPLATTASRVRSQARIESLRAQSAAEDLTFGRFNSMRSNQGEELPIGKQGSLVTDFGDEEMVGNMPSLITKTMTKFLHERGSIDGLEDTFQAAAFASAAASAVAPGMPGYPNFQQPRDSLLNEAPAQVPPGVLPQAAQARGRPAIPPPAFLPLGEENPGLPLRNLPQLSPPPATNSLPIGAGGFSPGGLLNLAQGQAGASVPPLYGGQGASPTAAAIQAQAAQMAHERLLMADASERFRQVGLDAGLSQLQPPSLGMDPRLASLVAAQSAFQPPNVTSFGGLPMAPQMGQSGPMPAGDLETMLTENLLKQRHHLQQLQLHQVQQQQMQLQQLMQAQQQQQQQQQPQLQQQLGLQAQLLMQQPALQSSVPPIGQAPRGGRGQERPNQRDTRGKEKSSPSKRQKEKQTTVMLRNLPVGYSRDMLVALMNRYGFEACFDFVYIPINFRTQAMFGYAFVNFVDELKALRARQVFEGFTEWGVETDKVCEVSWSDMHQGLLAHVNRYRSSPVMHESVPDEYKPAVYSQGQRVAFPAPTKRIRVPRIRRAPEGGEDDGGEDDFGLDGDI